MIYSGGAAPTIQSLPEELLLHVWAQLRLLENRPPSEAKFDGEPALTLTQSKETPLKDLSLVCKRWRYMLLPSLFSHSRVALSPEPRWIALTPRLLQSCERYVTIHPQASERELGIIQDMRRLFWASASSSTAPSAIEYVGDDTLLLQTGKDSLLWIPSARGDISDYLAFIMRSNLQSAVKSFTLSTSRTLEGMDCSAAHSCAVRECSTLWKTVFATISPLRVVVAAHPTVMALMTCSRLGTHDDWLFQQQLHYIEFTRRQQDDGGGRPRSPFQAALHNIRDWTHLSYNEGSSIPAYKQYEYFHYTPPCVLRYLLLWISKEQERDSGPRLRSVKYVACFPLAGHVGDVLDTVAGLSSVRDVETRLSPDRGSDLLDDARMGRSDPKDCWQEWNQCYRAVSRFVERMLDRDRQVAVKVADYGNEALADELDKILQGVGGLTRKDDVWRGGSPKDRLLDGW